MQIGQEKCLVILGIRLRDLPEPGTCLQHHDLHLIALVPRTLWTRPEVNDALEKAAKRTGVPRVIVNDYGVDLHGPGAKLSSARIFTLRRFYDIKHKAACLLKHRLEKDPRWQEFQRQVGQTRCAVQQTEVSFLVPPTPKPKARFTGLQFAVGVGGRRRTGDLSDPPAQVLKWASPERLQAKLGWLHEFADVVSEWSHWQQVVNIAVEYVARHQQLNQ